MGKYEVTIEKAKGSCEKAQFQKLAKNGDVQAEPISKQVGRILTITGYAKLHIETDNKSFDNYIYACEDGYYSSGSEYFKNSVETYYDDTKTFKVNKIETKKGYTYKAIAIFTEEQENE